jgi:hypothetical protein
LACLYPVGLGVETLGVKRDFGLLLFQPLEVFVLGLPGRWFGGITLEESDRRNGVIVDRRYRDGLRSGCGERQFHPMQSVFVPNSRDTLSGNRQRDNTECRDFDLLS